MFSEAQKSPNETEMNSVCKSKTSSLRLALVFGAIAFFCGEAAVSAERFEFYNGIRQMGMGGAAIATVNDETALLLNPAGLGKIRGPIFTIFDPEVHANGAPAQTYKDTTGSDLMDLQDLMDWAKTAPGKQYHARLQVFPSFVTTNFGIGVLGKFGYDGGVNTAGTSYRLDYINDMALVLGYNVRLFDGIVKIGTSGRIINRIEAHEDIPTGRTDLSWSEFQREGLGVAADGGILVTIPWKWLPTFAAVWRDMGQTSFSSRQGLFKSTSLRPADVKQTVDVGFSATPILGNKTRLQITGEYRDINNIAEETAPLRRFHGGMELNFSDTFFLRAGANQGFWSAGMELVIMQFQMQLASYGEDIGTSLLPVEDRRYMAKFSVRF
jgi:hypothetical protein